MHYLGNAESLFSNRSTGSTASLFSVSVIVIDCVIYLVFIGEAAKKNRRLGFRMLVQARKLVVNRVPDINFSEDELKIITVRPWDCCSLSLIFAMLTFFYRARRSSR